MRTRNPQSGGKLVTIGARLPGELVAKIDALAERMTHETGVPMTRTDALRVMVQAFEEEDKKKR
jgi:hypothetical protein